MKYNDKMADFVTRIPCQPASAPVAQGDVPLPEPVGEDAHQQEGAADADDAEELLQAGEYGLLRHEVVEVADGEVGQLGVHAVHPAAEEADVVLLEVAHPAVEDGGAQRGGYAGAYEAEHAQALEEVLEGHALGNVDGERDVEYAVAYALEEVGQVEALDVEVGVDEEVHVVLVDHDEQEAHGDEQLVALVEDGLAVEDDGGAGQDADEDPPVEGDGVERVVVEDGTHELVLQHRGGGEEEAEHEKEEEDDGEVAVAEHLRLDVGAAHGAHAVDVDQQGHHGGDDAGAYDGAVEPVVVLAIDAHEDNGEEDDAPQDAAQPVDAIQGQLLHGAEGTGEEQHAGPHDEQHADDKPMHVAPVGPVADVGGHQAGELDAFEHDDVDDGVEDGEIARGRDAEAHVGEALEGAPHAEEARHEAHDDEDGQAVDVQGDEVAGYQHGADGEEDAARGETELQAEEDGEYQGHADEGGVASHLHVFLYATQRA